MTQSIVDIIVEEANAHGLDPETMVRIARVESGLNPRAKNPKSSASGVFQFINSTWSSYGRGGDVFDARTNIRAAMRLTQDNARYLTRKLGRAPTGGELYLAHQQGAGGAARLLSNPSASAASIVGNQAVALNGGSTGMTAGDFARLWDGKLNNTQGLGGNMANSGLVRGVRPDTDALAAEVTTDPMNTNSRIGYGDVVPAQGQTIGQQQEEQRAADALRPGNLEAVGIAIQNEWSITAPFKSLAGYVPDPEYRLTRERLKEYGEGIPDQYLGEFSDSVSDSHAKAIRERLLVQLERNQRLASLGTTGTVLSMGAALTDPGAIAATLAVGAATGGLGLPAAIGARLGRVGLVGLGAAEGVAGNVLVDAPLIAVDPTRDESDLMWSLGAGLVMGGAFGTIGRGQYLSQEYRAISAVGQQMQRESVSRKLATSGIAEDDSINAARVVPEPGGSRIERLSNIYSRLAQGVKAEFGRVRFDSVGGLLKSDNPGVRLLARYLGEDAVRAGRGQVTQIAASEVSNRLFRASDVRWKRRYGAALGTFYREQNAGFFTKPKLEEDFRRQVTAYIRAESPAEKAQFPASVRSAGDAFNTEMKQWWEQAKAAGLTLTSDGVENYFPRMPYLQRTAELINRYSYGTGKKANGLTGLFTNAIMAKNPNLEPELARAMAYAVVDRFHKLGAGTEMSGRFGGTIDADDLEEALSEYLTPAQIEKVKQQVGARSSRDDYEDTPDFDLEDARSVLFDDVFRDFDGLLDEVNALRTVKQKDARLRAAFDKLIRDQGGKANSPAYAAGITSPRRLKEFLEDTVGFGVDMTKVRRGIIKAAAQRSNPTEAARLRELAERLGRGVGMARPEAIRPANSRLHHRILMDENFVGQVQNRLTGQMEDVRITDFYIDDPILAMQAYSRSMAGWVALSRIQIRDPETGDLVLNGVRNHEDWKKLKADLAAVGQRENANWSADEKKLDYLFSAITGTPRTGVDEASDFATATRMLRDFNFARLMGQVGLAQIPEMMVIVSQVGLKTALQSGPSLRRLMQRIQSGDVDLPLAYELEDMMGVGRDYERGRFFVNADEWGTPLTRGTDTAIQRANASLSPKLHAMNQFVATYSGMYAINGALQRWGSRAIAMNFAKQALGQTKANVNRLKAAGLTPEDVEEIYAAIRAHAKDRNGQPLKDGGMIGQLGLANWDGNTAAKFEDAMYRMLRSMILENDPGQFAAWMTTPLGKTILQFRTFAIGSWTKALLQGANLRDTEAALTVMTTTLMGALVYAGQTYVNAIGSPSAQEKLADRLSIENLALAGITRSTWSSFLPQIFDTGVMRLAGQDPLFDFRNTGQSTDVFLGNPTVDLINSAVAGVGGITSTVFGDDYSQEDYRNLTRSLPFQRLMGITQVLNFIGSGIAPAPERENR